MYSLNLCLEQIATLELLDIDYVIHSRNADGVTFKVEFKSDQEFTKALEMLISL